MRTLVSMREALSDPAYFGSVLAGPTWDAWRVLLIAIMGEPLDAEELATFTSLTGRTASPAEPVEAFWAVIGRRGGKTRAIAVLASYLAGCVDHRDILGPGERGILPVMAASVLQASQAFNFIHGAIDGSSHLSRLIESVTADTVSLASGVNIQVRPASFRTIRGISAVGAILDEIAFFRSDNSKNPDEEIVRALRPSLATTGGPLICISSPYAKTGMLWKTFRKHYGADGAPEILVAKAASRTMNHRCLRGWSSVPSRRTLPPPMPSTAETFDLTFRACLISRLSRLRSIVAVSSDLVCLGCATLRLLTLRAVLAAATA